jgi:hypothetical protein
VGGLLRCDGCGSIRWDVLGLEKGKDPVCETCGRPLKPERRHPGRRARHFDGSLKRERRDLAAPLTKR